MCPQGPVPPCLRRSPGFTLVELMVVMALVALASATVILSWRDPQQDQLQQEAERLAALLEAARAESRLQGQALFWQAQPQTQTSTSADFSWRDARGQAWPPDTPGPAALTGPSAWPRRWLQAGVQAQVVNPDASALGRLQLGPEPWIGPQQVWLSLGAQRLRLATDGLSPFAVQVDLKGNPP